MPKKISRKKLLELASEYVTEDNGDWGMPRWQMLTILHNMIPNFKLILDFLIFIAVLEFSDTAVESALARLSHLIEETDQ